MEYWISQNGKKKGPLKEWDIRALIEDEGLTEEDLIWHSSLPKWEKLRDYTAFRSYFQKPVEVTPEDAEIEEAKKELQEKIEQVTGKKVSPGAIIRIEKIEKHYWVRRGFAKIFDLFLYFVSFFIASNYFGLQFVVDPKLALIQLVFLVPFFIIEGFLIHYWGVTPGKFILGLRVRTLAGMPPMNYNRSLIRSAASWFFGMALGFPPYYLISMILSYFTTKQRGLTTWDAIARSKVESVRPVKAFAIINYIILCFTISFMNNAFILSHEPTKAAISELLLEHAPQLEEQIRQLYELPNKPDPS